MTINIVVAGATESFIKNCAKPLLESRKDCVFTLVTKENLVEQENIKVISCDDDLKIVAEAVEQIKRDVANSVLMKNSVQTADLLRAVLKTENGLKTDRLLSQVTQVELVNGRKFLLTDPALNITPGVDEKIQITENVIDVAKKIGLNKPKVALLSSVEVFNPKMPSSADAHAVAEHFSNRDDVIVEGPISMDLSVGADAAKAKGYKGKIQGDAEVLVVPNIDAGNILYKTFAQLMDAKMSGILVGPKIPIVLTSRSDSYEAKLNSLNFALATVKK